VKCIFQGSNRIVDVLEKVCCNDGGPCSPDVSDGMSVEHVECKRHVGPGLEVGALPLKTVFLAHVTGVAPGPTLHVPTPKVENGANDLSRADYVTEINKIAWYSHRVSLSTRKSVRLARNREVGPDRRLGIRT
jgi:hypothetical protein